MKILIFDFDGVFADAFQVSLEELQKLHSKYNLKDIGSNDFQNLFCGNFWEEHAKYGLPKEQEDNLKKELLKNVQSRQNEIPFYTGTKKLLETIALLKIPSLIISSNKKSSLEEKLSKITKEKIFKEILGADSPGNKHEKIIKLLKNYHANSEVYFITDTVGDLREVKSLPITTVAVSWGFHPKEWLASENPQFLLESVDELIIFLKTHVGS